MIVLAPMSACICLDCGKPKVAEEMARKGQVHPVTVGDLYRVCFRSCFGATTGPPIF